MIIVGFGHRSRVGKDTAGRFLLSYLRQNRINCARLSFFGKAKEMAAQLYGWAGLMDEVYYDNHPEYRDRPLAILGKTPVQVWLEFGYYLRQIHPATLPEFALQGQTADVLVSTDLRSMVEMDYLRKFNGLAYRIDRDVERNENKYKGHEAYFLDSTLADFEGWDGIIDNNKTMKEFNTAVTEIGEEVIRRLKK